MRSTREIEVLPEEITESFLTITHPTDGFILVFPKLILQVFKS